MRDFRGLSANFSLSLSLYLSIYLSIYLSLSPGEPRAQGQRTTAPGPGLMHTTTLDAEAAATFLPRPGPVQSGPAAGLPAGARTPGVPRGYAESPNRRGPMRALGRIAGPLSAPAGPGPAPGQALLLCAAPARETPVRRTPQTQRPLLRRGRCFAVTGIQGSSVVLTCSRWYPSQLESCTGCRRIRSKLVSRGITRICAVTVLTNIYWRWANRTENLPFGSVGLL